MIKLAILSSFSFFCFLFFIKNGYLYSSIGVAFSLFIFIDFVDKIGKQIPIKEFIVLIASMQWIIGSKISYSLGKVHHKYFMYVDEETYMSYVVPSVIIFWLGLSLIKSNLSIDKIKNTVVNNRLEVRRSAFTLIFIGVSSIILRRLISSGGLAFILYLLELFLYVGIGYIFFIYPKSKFRIFISLMGIIFLFSLNTGMFHKLLLVGSFLVFFLFSKHKTFISKASLILLSFVFVYVLQSVKKDYREIIWSSNSVTNPGQVFVELIKKEFLVEESNKISYASREGEIESESDLNNRLNQGWIISKTLENVPKNTPFLNGETIVESFTASLLPRFLFPSKAGAEKALENFKKITGLQLSDRTSMGLSISAEFYANFGIFGGWFAIFIYGIGIGLVIRFIVNSIGQANPLILFWFILFFFQVVKAETDFIKIFNHLVKAIILFMILKSVLSYFNIQLLPNQMKEDNHNADI